jgi:hypothetical protein
MIDMKRNGMRCAAKKMIRSHEVTVQPANQGTIIYEVENLGRRLIFSAMGWQFIHLRVSPMRSTLPAP